MLQAVILSAILIAAPSYAETIYKSVKAVVVDVHDGDTLKVDIDTWPSVIGRRIGVRVYGVDTRELKDGGMVARERVRLWIKPGDTIWLIGVRRDKYFRLLADVGYNCSKEDDPTTCKRLAEELIKNKLAVPYFGEKKQKFPDYIQ